MAWKDGQERGNLMKFGIICAGDSEAEPFLSLLHETNVTEKAMLTCHEGTIENLPVVVLFSGVCKVNAAIAAQILIDTFQCDHIINGGTAGGMDESVQILDTVVATETAYHDVEESILTEFHPWMPSIFMPSDPDLLELAHKAAEKLKDSHHTRFGRMVTGEQFIVDENRDRINQTYGPLSVDMETAAIAHVCYVNRIPFIAVRTITDTAKHSGEENFELNCSRASQRSADFVKMMLALSLSDQH